MFAIHATRGSRPVCVLLGGSGRALAAKRKPMVAALFRPRPTELAYPSRVTELRAA